MHGGTTRFAPINRAPRRWAPGLAAAALMLLALLASINIPYA